MQSGFVPRKKILFGCDREQQQQMTEWKVKSGTEARVENSTLSRYSKVCADGQRARTNCTGSPVQNENDSQTMQQMTVSVISFEPSI
jgi:hypothetical protein